MQNTKDLRGRDPSVVLLLVVNKAYDWIAVSLFANGMMYLEQLASLNEFKLSHEYL